MPNSFASIRPQATEHAPYYTRYIALVPDGNILDTLLRQMEQIISILGEIPEERAGYRYAPGKWSLKEVLGHMIDTERIFAYRALRFARGDQTPLPGYEQDDYVLNAGFDGLTLKELIDQFEQVRKANIGLFKSFGEKAWQRPGIANEKQVTVRALVWLIAGHERHHLGVLKEKYF